MSGRVPLDVGLSLLIAQRPELLDLANQLLTGLEDHAGQLDCPADDRSLAVIIAAASMVASNEYATAGAADELCRLGKLIAKTWRSGERADRVASDLILRAMESTGGSDEQ